MFGRVIFNAGTQQFLFNNINPGRKYMTIFEFLQRPHVNPNPSVPLTNMKNNFPPAMCETAIPKERHLASKKAPGRS